jgi:hypothetical protein
MCCAIGFTVLPLDRGPRIVLTPAHLPTDVSGGTLDITYYSLSRL